MRLIFFSYGDREREGEDVDPRAQLPLRKATKRTFLFVKGEKEKAIIHAGKGVPFLSLLVEGNLLRGELQGSFWPGCGKREGRIACCVREKEKKEAHLTACRKKKLSQWRKGGGRVHASWN